MLRKVRWGLYPTHPISSAVPVNDQQLLDAQLSSVESPPLTSPYDTASLYSNAMAAHHQVDLLGGNKQPPSYEDCIKNAQSIQSLQNMNNMENYGYSMGSPFQDIIGLSRKPGSTLGKVQRTDLMNAQRAANGHSVQMGEQGLSPPYSNQSPPHSVQSNIALSPHAYLGSPSPAKSRPSLPTSPTHIQAMRHATHQKHGPPLSGAGQSLVAPNSNSSSSASSFQQSPSSMSQQNSPVKMGLISPTGSDMGMMVPQQQQQQNSAIMPQSMQLGGLEFGSAGLDLNGFCGSPDSFSGQMNPPSIQSSNSGSSSSNILSPSSQHNAAFYQYLTPPSQHSGGHTPQHLVQTLDSYPTPSPESPGHWSSASPRSTSDWSEGVQSPQGPNNMYMTAGHQANKGSEAIYI